MNFTIGCTTCGWEHRVRTWTGETLWVILRHMSLLGWSIELAPTIRLWCPTCAAKTPPLAAGGVT